MAFDNSFDPHDGRKSERSVNLNTSIVGIKMTSPVIAGSCPLNINPETIRQLVTAGVGAVVLPSMLQEQLVYQLKMKADPRSETAKSGQAAQQERYNGGPEEYLKSLATLKANFRIPVIASIHGASTGDWLDYCCRIQDSGADGLELNWQIGRCDPNESGDLVESRMLNWLAQIRARVRIPIIFKMNARFTNPASTAIRLQNAGADGLVLFAHCPNWDVAIDTIQWTIAWELSPIPSLGKTLEGLVVIHTKSLSIPVAASGGIRTGEDAIKSMIAGANVVMIVSELYRQGPDAVRDILAGIQRYLDTKNHRSLEDFLKSRTGFELRQSDSMRAEIVESLTTDCNYADPTPVAREISGDRFGHPSH